MFLRAWRDKYCQVKLLDRQVIQSPSPWDHILETFARILPVAVRMDLFYCCWMDWNEHSRRLKVRKVSSDELQLLDLVLQLARINWHGRMVCPQKSWDAPSN